MDKERLQEYKLFYLTYKDAHLHTFEQEECFTKFLELITALERYQTGDMDNINRYLLQERNDLRKQLEEAQFDLESMTHHYETEHRKNIALRKRLERLGDKGHEVCFMLESVSAHVIKGQKEEIADLRKQLQQAQAWSVAWKRKAKQLNNQCKGCPIIEMESKEILELRKQLQQAQAWAKVWKETAGWKRAKLIKAQINVDNLSAQFNSRNRTVGRYRDENKDLRKKLDEAISERDEADQCLLDNGIILELPNYE